MFRAILSFITTSKVGEDGCLIICQGLKLDCTYIIRLKCIKNCFVIVKAVLC